MRDKDRRRLPRGPGARVCVTPQQAPGWALSSPLAFKKPSDKDLFKATSPEVARAQDGNPDLTVLSSEWSGPTHLPRATKGRVRAEDRLCPGCAISPVLSTAPHRTGRCMDTELV